MASDYMYKVHSIMFLTLPVWDRTYCNASIIMLLQYYLILTCNLLIMTNMFLLIFSMLELIFNTICINA